MSHVRDLIERGALKPGDRLPAERDLATQIGVSRPTVRAGLRTLAAMGVVQSRHGSGTYIPDGPPALGTEPLSFLAALHGFTREEMYEARRILEVGAAGLAAERATSEQLATLAEEVASLFASTARAAPVPGARHQLSPRRRRGVGQPDRRRRWSRWSRRSTTSGGARPRRGASERDLRDAAEMHRRIYQAIRARDAEAARRAMHDHLIQASRHQAQEPGRDATRPSTAARRRRRVRQIPQRRARVRRRPSSV